MTVVIRQSGGISDRTKWKRVMTGTACQELAPIQPPTYSALWNAFWRLFWLQVRDHATQSEPTGSLDYVYCLSQSLSMGDWRCREHGRLTRDETIITDVSISVQETLHSTDLYNYLPGYICG
jgi:hypothetical protein